MTTDEFPLDDDLDDEDEDQGAPGDSKVIRELRKQFNQAKRELKAERLKTAELETFKATAEKNERKQAVVTVADKLGLSEKQAYRLLRLQPELELTEEAIRAAAIEEEFLVPAEDETPAAPERPFVPITTSQGTPPTSQIEYAEYLELQRTNPAGAIQAYMEGRVKGIEKTSGESRGFPT